MIAREQYPTKRNGVVSYRSRVFNHDRKFEPRSRTRLLAIVGAVAVVGGVGGALLIPNVGSVFGASNAANVAGTCATPSATSTAAGTTAAGTTATAAATPSGTAATVAPTPSGTAAAPVATTPATAAATTAATPTTTATTAATGRRRPRPRPRRARRTTTATATPTATAAAAAAAANVSCDIVVPANPLTAQGLATPFQLTGTDGATPAVSGCNMANNANLGAFVQATILNPATGALSVYEPLVITQGTTPAAAPVVPTLPANAIVTIDFGFNGTNLTQVGATPNALAQGRCVNGLGGSIFGQVSFCNGTQFFRAVARAKAAGKLLIPPLGTATKTGQPCLTTRNFDVVDQDPSDNVTTTYLLTANGDTAQDNPTNEAALTGATPIVNGSDNKLLDSFLDPTIGCTPFEAPDLTTGGTLGTSQALDEISAQNQAAPVALVPENDEMVLVNNAFSVAKTNLYRENLGQAPVSAANDTTSSPANFCQNMVNIQTPFLANNQALLATDTSPVPTVGDNLLTFMANRLSMSFTNLNCQNFGLTDPVTVTLDGNGAATAATFNTAQQTATAATTAAGSGATGAGMPAPGQRMGRRHHRMMNPSGM